MNVGMVFAMIFAIIVIAFVLAFGTGVITNMFCIGNVATIDNSVKNLETAVENVYLLAEGSTDIYNLKIPKGSKVCFIDPEHPEINPAGGWLPDIETRNMTINRIRSGSYNMWINYNCGTQNPYYKIEHLSVTSNFCLDGTSNLYLENQGLLVGISKQ